MVCLFFLSVTFQENLITNAVEINGNGTESLTPENVEKITIVSKMKEITIKGIIEITKGAFQGCYSVTAVYLPSCIVKIGSYAFDGLTKLQYVSFENTDLETIEPRAFQNTGISCPITFPAKLNFIGDFSFSKCYFLPSITFENTVKLSIKGSSFTENSKIAIIDLSSVPVELFVDCFMQLSGLTKVIIGDLVEITDGNPFHTCENLVTIEITGSVYFSSNSQILYSGDKTKLYCLPCGLTGTVTLLPETTTIVNSAARKSRISEVIGLGVTSLNTLSFYSSKIQKVSFPVLKTIASRAFESSSLQSIKLPNTCEDIHNAVFGQCLNLSYIFLPNSIKVIRGGFLAGCSDLTDVDIEPGGTLLEKDATTGIVTSKDNPYYGYQPFFVFIPPTQKNITIPGTMRVIPFGCFKSMGFIESITISSPNTKIIEAEAFSYTSITELFIPKTVTATGAAFCYSCKKLIKVEYEEGSPLTTIASQGLQGCSVLTTIILHEDSEITQFGMLSVYACYALKSFIFPPKLTKIDAHAFAFDSSLEEITLRGTSVTIAFNSFLNCNSLSLITFDTNLVSSFSFQDLKLKKLIFSSKIVEIGTSAFSRNLLLHTLEFDNLTNNLVTVGTNAFSSCILLKEVYFPGSVKELTANIFHGCNSLISVKVNSNEYKTINGILYSKTEDILILCPSGLGECHVSNLTTKLGKYSFAGCLNLKNVYLSSNISRIEDFCFFECSKLKSFNIPTGIKYIGESPLFKCESLKLISYCGTTDKDIFTPNRNDLLPEKSILLVSNKYLGDTFLGKKVLKSDSLDPYDCPNLPSLFFSINKHAKKFHNFNTNFGMMILKYLFFIHH